MTIDATSNARAGSLAGQVTQTAGTPSSTSAIGDMGPDAFMKLLVTQIKNQDPMNPMDSKELMTQLSQLTSVERLVKIDDRLASLSVATAGVASAQAADFIGTTIEADTSGLRLNDLGSASGAFALDGSAENVTVKIRDGEGRLVRTLELGARSPGTQRLEWDGKNDDGTRLAPGQYSVTVSAANSAGAVDARTRIRGTATTIRYENGFPELAIGDTYVALGDVRTVSGAEPASRTTTDTQP